MMKLGEATGRRAGGSWGSTFSADEVSRPHFHKQAQEAHEAIVLGTGLCRPDQWHLVQPIHPRVMPSSAGRVAWWWVRESYRRGHGRPDAAKVARALLDMGQIRLPSTVFGWIEAVPVSNPTLRYVGRELIAAASGGGSR